MLLCTVAPACWGDGNVGDATRNDGGPATGGGSATNLLDASSGGSSGGTDGAPDASSGGSTSVGQTDGSSTGGTSAYGGNHGTGGLDIPESGTHSLCGNGRIDSEEQCDDGNTLDEDDCSSICTDNRPCLACTGNNCPFDPVVQPRCADFPDSTSQGACYAAYACMVRTECFLSTHAILDGGVVDGVLSCICGTTGLLACKDGGGNGPCKSEIEAAFRAAPGSLTVVDDNAIINSFGDITIPAGAALNLMQCEHDYCGDPALGGGWECSPTRHAGNTGG